MKVKPVAIALGLVGQVLIALTFFYMIPPEYIEKDIRILDAVVSSIVYWLWVANVFFAPIDLNDPTQKQVGSLGIKWWAVGWYTFLSLGVMICCILMNHSEPGSAPFKYQLMAQAGLLFLFLIASYASQSAGDQTARVYYKEEKLKADRRQVKTAINSLLETCYDSSDVPSDIVKRLESLVQEMRYVSPSNAPDAQAADDAIFDDCAQLRPALMDYNMNKEFINKKMERLERNVKRRKQALM